MSLSPSFDLPEDRVAIALCTYNGAGYINEQLSSLLRQTHPVQIMASDDVSTDETLEELAPLLRFGIDRMAIRLNNSGHVKNFESNLIRALATDAQYFAFSDQDDLWSENRIERGMDALRKLEENHGVSAPLLVHSDLRLMNAKGELTHESFLEFRKYRINQQRNLQVILGENGVMGNTILLNRTLAEMCLPFPEGLHVHDYWVALMAELFGQRMLLDEPLVDYRLHANNASNTAKSMGKGSKSRDEDAFWKKLLERNFKLPYKEDSRLLALEHLMADEDRFPALSSEQKESIKPFIEYLKFHQSRWRSLKYLLSSGVVRKGFMKKLRLSLVVLITARYDR